MQGPHQRGKGLRGLEPFPPTQNQNHTEDSVMYSVNYILSASLHVQMMLVGGFGFLMTFLKRHAFMSLGMTLFIVVLSTEWSILLHGCE